MGFMCISNSEKNYQIFRPNVQVIIQWYEEKGNKKDTNNMQREKKRQTLKMLRKKLKGETSRRDKDN